MDDQGVSGWGDADQALAKVNAQIAEAQRTAEKARALDAEMKTLVGRAQSRGREVTASVSAAGLLVDLNLTDKAFELDERALGRLIMQTVNDAHQAVGEKAVNLTAEAFGEDSAVTARIRAEAEARQQRPQEPEIRY